MATTPRTKKAVRVHDRLLDALSEVERPGEVCIGGDRLLTMPGLEVRGLGAVRLPLGKTQARKLIKICRQAPYGKGTETVVDTDVRRVWELDPDRFQLTNQKWDDLVASIIDEVQLALGLEGRRLAAQLYKLLLYEEGGFFLPHRDGEKLERMVATLVIGLPAVHEGGELIVSHDGREHEIVFAGAASGHELSYAAFYADCQHEVRPVQSGYRLCLTYNLTLAKSRGKKGIAAPSYGGAVVAISDLLQKWRDAPDPQKLAVTLEHRYTQDGLSVDRLKGIDRAQADVLFEAAEQADCVAHLALVTLWQSGSAEGGYDEYGYGYGRGYRWSDDDEEDDETGTQYEMGEIFDHSLSANHWSDRQGRKVKLGEIHLDENEIVTDEALDEADPNRFEEELTTVIEAATAATIARNAELLRTLCVGRDKDSQRIDLCQRMCERSVKALAALDAQPPDSDWRYGEIDRAALLSSLVTAMLAIDAQKQLSDLIKHALACDKYDLTDGHLAAIFALQSRLEKPANANSAIRRWLAACRRVLKKRTAKAPRKPGDYRRADKLSCDCADCRALGKFLASPNQREGRFPLAKDRRRHLHNIIDHDRCDCTHITERRGSPYTLVCTKTMASYEAACRIHERDLKNLARIIALEQKIG